MQSTSALYKSIIADDHYFEYKLDIDGVGSIPQEEIAELKTYNTVFGGKPEIGKAVVGEIDAAIRLPEAEIPQMAILRPYVRACNDTQKSEWLPQGVFMIDTRMATKNGHGLDALTIHGYDAMLKAEQAYTDTALVWDARDVDIVSEIASKMGVNVDSRTVAAMTEGYTLPLPTGYTLREYLGFIAAFYVGCFVISDEGKLKLVSLLELPPETNYLIDDDGSAITFGGVRILV